MKQLSSFARFRGISAGYQENVVRIDDTKHKSNNK